MITWAVVTGSILTFMYAIGGLIQLADKVRTKRILAMRAAREPLPELELPASFRYDWLRDSGSMWEPGSTAFWLEPETCDELAAWVNKYRPTQYGLYVVNDDVRIEWIEPVPLMDASNYLPGSVYDYMMTDEEWRNYYRRRAKMPGGLM